MFRRLTIILMVLISLTVVTACGNSGATPLPASSTSAAQATAVPTSAPEVVPTAVPQPTQAPTPTAAPTATDVPESAAGGANCLIGTWKFDDMSTYFSSIMSKAGNPAKYVGQEGTVIYTFGADGQAKIDAQNFKAKLELTVSNVSIPMTINMTGSATASYVTSDDNKVTFSDSNIGDFKFSVTVNGQETPMMTGDELAAFGMSPDPKYNTFTYECSADTLRYTPPIEGAQPVILKRASP
jgi:hypothetical protein